MELAKGQRMTRTGISRSKRHRPLQGKVDLIVFDFDGVLTNNRVLVLEDGREGVFCNRADGLGFDLLRAAGIQGMIISTETNAVVRHRARKLKVPVAQSVKDKGRTVLEICRKKRIDPRRMAFVGNDVNDLPALRVAGYKLCPRDAAPEVRRICDHVLRCRGGEGVAREIAMQIERLFQ